MPNAPHTADDRPRILLVEDDAALLRALSFTLRIEGYDVEPMASAEALLAQPLDGHLIIVTDQNLPELTGLEALSLLRRRGVAAPAVLITAELPRKLEAQALSLGLTVIEKPILGDGLLAALRGLWAS